MVLGVVFQVAALAPRAQVGIVAVLRDMVEVGNGQHDPAAGVRVLLVILGATIRVCRAALAAIACALQYRRPDFLPVGRVAGSIFRLDRHRSLSRLRLPQFSL